MIRRHDQNHYSTVMGDFHQMLTTPSNDPTRQKTARYCACGTKLRRSKQSWELLCDPCDDKRIRALADAAIEEFIPVDPPVATSKHHPTATCGCGRPMWRQSQRCRRCHDQMIRERSGIVGGSRPPTAAPSGHS